MVKTQLHSREPLTTKGSFSAAIYKGKGQMAYIDTHRSISLCSILAKHHHAYMRTKYTNLLRITRSSQTGGLQGRGADMANLLVRARQDQARAEGKSVITIYIDLVSAFYRAI